MSIRQRPRGVMGILLALSCAAPAPSTDPEPLILSDPVEFLGTVAVREPMVVEHPTGVLFVAGYTQAVEESLQPPKLFKSLDGGLAWEPVKVGTPADGAVGNSDVDLAVTPDGTLYFLTMGFDRATGEGTHVSVGVSRDVGATWSWSLLSQKRLVDRPWIRVAPDGRVLVIWNDGEGVSLAVSTDGGHSWSDQDRIHHQGGSSHMAVGPEGQIAVRISPVSASGNRFDAGVDLLKISTDGGETWTQQTPPGQRNWSPDVTGQSVLPRWVEPVAWDGDALFSLWSEGSTLWLGRSLDLGATWVTWQVVTDQSLVFYPNLVSDGRGQLAATWFSVSSDSLTANVGLFGDIGGSQPVLRRSTPFPVDAWRQTTAGPVRDPGGEYFPVLFLSAGDLGVATPIQNPQAGRLGFSWIRVAY